MARISYEDIVNLISPEDINTLKMCICKASGLPPKFLENPAHEHVEPPRKKYISLPPRNESGSRSNIWLCDQVPENGNFLFEMKGWISSADITNM